MLDKLDQLRKMTEAATSTTIANDGAIVAQADVDSYNDELEIINDAQNRIKDSQAKIESYKDKIATGKDGNAILKDYENEYNECFDILSQFDKLKEVTVSEPVITPAVEPAPYKINLEEVDKADSVTYSDNSFEPDLDAYKRLVSETLDGMNVDDNNIQKIELPTEVETPLTNSYDDVDSPYSKVVSAGAFPFKK